MTQPAATATGGTTSFLRVRTSSNRMFFITFDPSVDTCLTVKRTLQQLLAVPSTTQLKLFSVNRTAASHTGTESGMDVWADDKRLQESLVDKCSLVFLSVAHPDGSEEPFSEAVLNGL